jgi:O-antigen ligase
MLLGFYFSVRISFTFLWFQGNPVTGSVVSIAIGLLLLMGTIVYSAGAWPPAALPARVPATVKWVTAFLGLALISVMWSSTQSYVAALGYWTSLLADVAMAWLVAHHATDDQTLHSIMKGFAGGACIVAVIAWMSPVTADLRLGNEDFLHPNVLGWLVALAALLAQYLSHWRVVWRWVALALVITLIRTLSKTSIVAFVIAETFFVLHDAKMTRRARVYIGLLAAVIIGCFWGLLETYADLYTAGNAPETLTGRTIIWAAAFPLALEQPWLGHGLDSFRFVITALGTYEPLTAHNELLQQFFVYGVVGVILVSGVYFSFYCQARRATESGLRTLALTVLIMALIRGLDDAERFDLSFPLWLLTLMSGFIARDVNYAQLNH